ncbi:MAG: hypothetical protein ACR2IV_13060 [Bryobacteraceae bacterium]
MRLTTLIGGGHIADFRFEDSAGSLGVSPLWVPPWRTIEPYQYREETHGRSYGTITEGKLLSGLVGHNICLDYFGSPSVEEARQGLSQHGEAASSKWQEKGISQTQERVTLKLSVRLPVSGLRFSREMGLRRNESIVYFKEEVFNERKADHFFQWAQHVTLGPPFLSVDDALVAVPGTKGLTFPHGYDEGKALLSSNEVFRWPNAPLLKGGTVDLSRPFLRRGVGFVVAVLLDKRKKVGFVAAVNRKLGVLIAYCFKRSDFPWVAIWEENLGITAPPWNRRTRARGLEFSTTPLPVPRREAFLLGKLFGEPTLTCVPAMAKRTVQYVAFLAAIPDGFGNVRDIELARTEVVIEGTTAKRSVVIKASGLKVLLE